MKWSRAAKKFVDLPIRAYSRTRQELPLASVEVTTLPPGSPLNAASVWTVAPVAGRVATIYVVGPDAGSVPAGLTVPVISVPPGGLDLYVRPTDAMESDPVYVDRITLA